MKGNEINISLRALCQQIRDTICIFIAPILVIVNSNCVAAVDRAVYKFNHVSIGLLSKCKSKGTLFMGYLTT